MTKVWSAHRLHLSSAICRVLSFDGSSILNSHLSRKGKRLPFRLGLVFALGMSVAAGTGASLVDGVMSGRTATWDGAWGEQLWDGCDVGLSCSCPVASRKVEQPYSIGLRGVTELRSFRDHTKRLPCYAAYLDDRRLSLVSTDNASGSGRDRPRVVAWSGSPESTPVRICDGQLLAAYRGERSGKLRLLCWNPAPHYERLPAASQLVASDLFLVNYSSEANLSQSACFDSALQAAARGDSLCMENFLDVRSSDGALLSRTELDPEYHPYAATVVNLEGRDVALVTFNSGYQVSEFLYRELTLPTMQSAPMQSPRAVARSYGSFRGVMAVDTEDGEVLWERRSGTQYRIPVTADLNGDTHLEILLSTYGPGNGISAGGTTDSDCSYVFCLDAHGNEIWRRRFLGWFSAANIAVGDLDGAGRPSIVVATGTNMDSNRGGVAILSGSGETRAENANLGNMSGLVLLEGVEGEAGAVFTGDVSGRLLRLDGRARVVDECTLDLGEPREKGRLRPMVADDIDGDGETEIVAFSVVWTTYVWGPNRTMEDTRYDADPDVVVFDSELDEEARLSVPPMRTLGRSPAFWQWMVADLDDDGVNEVMVNARDRAAFVLEVIPAGADRE